MGKGGLKAKGGLKLKGKGGLKIGGGAKIGGGVKIGGKAKIGGGAKIRAKIPGFSADAVAKMSTGMYNFEKQAAKFGDSIMAAKNAILKIQGKPLLTSLDKKALALRMKA